MVPSRAYCVSNNSGWYIRNCICCAILTSICRRCQRLSSNTQCDGLQEFTQGLKGVSSKADKVQPVATSGKSVGDEKLGATFWNSLHSWVHPQSSLPPAVLSGISSAAARGGEAGNRHTFFDTTYIRSRHRLCFSIMNIFLATWDHDFLLILCSCRYCVSCSKCLESLSGSHNLFLFPLMHSFILVMTWQNCYSFLNDTVLGRLHFDRCTTHFALKPALYFMVLRRYPCLGYYFRSIGRQLIYLF